VRKMNVLQRAAAALIVVAAWQANAQVPSAKITAVEIGTKFTGVVNALGQPEHVAAHRCAPNETEPGLCLTYRTFGHGYRYARLDLADHAGVLRVGRCSWTDEPPPAYVTPTADPFASVPPPPVPSKQGANALDENMSMDQVRAILGVPDATEQKTCGGANGVDRWSCRVWRYEIDRRTLLVYFAQPSDGLWLVNHWGWP
jgi:hypothetical protein